MFPVTDRNRWKRRARRVREAKVAARRSAPALEQTQPVTIEGGVSAKEPATVAAQQNTQGGAVSNAPSPKGDATPDIRATPDSASSDSQGGAPAAEAPPAAGRNDDAAPRATFAQVEERIRKATTIDALDEAATLIQTFGVREQKDLTREYRERRALETELERRLRETTDRAEKAEDRLRYLEDLHTRGAR